jgi:hypothetical protein
LNILSILFILYLVIHYSLPTGRQVCSLLFFLYSLFTFIIVPKQIIQDTFEKIKDQAVSTAKAVVKEPSNVIKKAVGQEPAPGAQEETSLQGATQSQPQISGPIQNQQDVLVKKKVEDQQKTQELLRFHREKLKEEEAYFSEQERVEKMQEQSQGAQAEEAEKKQIEQLKKQEEKEAALQPASAPKGIFGALGKAKKLKGTKEKGRFKD